MQRSARYRSIGAAWNVIRQLERMLPALRTQGMSQVSENNRHDFLLRLGVPVGQGFLFAPGLHADEFGYRLIEEQRRAG